MPSLLLLSAALSPAAATSAEEVAALLPVPCPYWSVILLTTEGEFKIMFPVLIDGRLFQMVEACFDELRRRCRCCCCCC